jgi:DNA-binding transcriptional ArsR family regulator
MAKDKEFVDSLIMILKNPTRASIFYQLIKKYEASATEIAKEIDVDVDIVYYHLKILRKIGIISDPKVIVKGNYVEKYYSVRPDFKEKLLGSVKQLLTREKEMDIEEFREMVIALLSVIQSILSNSIRELREADTKLLDVIREKNYLESKIIFCNRDRYIELLRKLRESVKEGVLETFDPVKKEYVIVVIGIPKINEDIITDSSERGDDK